MTQETPDLGPCCACEKTGEDARNILFINRRSPTPGKGWGCLQCGIPNDGAVAVFCDDCFRSGAEPQFVCTGYPASDGRTPFAELSGEKFDHDLTKHPETIDVD